MAKIEIIFYMLKISYLTIKIEILIVITEKNASFFEATNNISIDFNWFFLNF